jgi:hypothetical protein
MDADKGVAPIYSGHEPDMLLLHQSAYTHMYNTYNSLKGVRTLECDDENIMS